MNQMIENVAMKLTHIHVAIHLSSFSISHQSSLSPLCLPVRNISLRPNSATSSTVHIDARTSWMGLIATFFSPSIRPPPQSLLHAQLFVDPRKSLKSIQIFSDQVCPNKATFAQRTLVLPVYSDVLHFH